MRVDWAVFCEGVERDAMNFLTLQRIFQVVERESLPDRLNCSCAMGFRGKPGEKITFEFKFFTPNGELTPPKPTAARGEMTFGEHGFYEFSTDFKEIPLQAFGEYRYTVYVNGEVSPMAFARFEVLETFQET